MTGRLSLRLLGFTIAVLACLLVAVPAGAVGGPHEGSFGTTTDACAGCHRAHTASAPKLLAAASQYALCMTCHDGIGADTNALDGIYMDTIDGTQGTVNAGLRGGGFENAKMDTDVNGTATAAATTSKHDVGVTGTIWGNGAISSGPGATGVTLQCSSCHNPHGNASYRILRPTPNDSGSASPVTVPDEIGKTYTITYDGDNYRDVLAYDDGVEDSIGDWCTQCHTRYSADNGDGSTDSGDATFMYRHTTTGMPISCLQCHVAHGTSAGMGSPSDAVKWPDGAPASGGNSRLLHIDGRGVCVRCHLDSGGEVIMIGHSAAAGCMIWHDIH